MTPFETLSSTQVAIVERLWKGKRVHVIARELGVEVATVRTHIRRIAKKLPNPHQLPAVRLIESFRSGVVR